MITRLAAVGIGDLSEVVDLAANAAHTAGLADPRITSDVKHVEIGLTDKSDSARWAADWLVLRGITGSSFSSAETSSVPSEERPAVTRS